MKETTYKYKNKTVKKRPDGRYYVRYRHNGQQYSIYAKTGEKCLENLKQALKQTPKEKIKNKDKKEKKQKTLNEWLEEWIKLYKENKVKETTLYKIKILIKRFIKEKIGKEYLTRLKALDVQHFIESIDKHRQKENIYLILKNSLVKAYQLKLIKENIGVLLEIKIKAKKSAKAFSIEEEKNFLKHAKNNKHNDLFLILLYQGIRKGELLALTNEDINLKERTMKITKTLNQFGKMDTTKTKSSNRIIPIFNKTYEILKKYENKKGKLFDIGKNQLQISFKEICEKAKLNDFVIHSLRHTFATRCLEIGITPKQTQTWLGHSNINITMGVYTHIQTEYEKENIKRIDTHFDTQK